MRTLILAVVLSATIGVVSQAAEAQVCSGTLSGVLKHAQRSGGWCDPALGTQNCAGSQYPIGAVSFGTIPGDVTGNKGLPEVQFVFRNAFGQVVAQGVTDVNGAFTVQWADFTNNCQGNMLLSLAVPLIHGGNRFRVVVPGALLPWILPAGPGSIPRAAAITLNPVNWGSWDVPLPMSNVYTSAFLVWNNALRTSATLLESFVNMDFQLPSDGSCNNGVACSECEEDERGHVFVDLGGAFDTFVVIHETGHTVSCAAHTTQFSGYWDYSRDGAGHTLVSQEYKSVTFEEGFADFVAASALWNAQTAVHPRVCNGAVLAPCVINSFQGECLEHGFGAANPCSTTNPDKKRQESTVTAYLWDLVDAQTDATDGIGVDTVDQSFADVIGTLHEYPQGYDNHQENEMVCCAFWICGACGGIFGNGSDRDNGRNVEDFNFWWSPLPFATAHAVNCSP